VLARNFDFYRNSLVTFADLNDKTDLAPIRREDVCHFTGIIFIRMLTMRFPSEFGAKMRFGFNDKSP
jgi:hypothetical protein